MTSLLKLLTLILLLMLPLPALSQGDEDDDSSVFVDPNQALIDSLLRVANSDVHDTVKARCYCSIGYMAESADTVLKYSGMSLDLCDQNNYALIGQNYSNEGWAYYMKDESSNAISVYHESLSNFKKIDDKFHIAVVSVALAKCYHEFNVRDSIFPYFDQALDIFLELKDTMYVTYVYRAIGVVNGDFGFDDNAMAYFMKAIVLDSVSNNLLDMACDYLNLSNVIDNDPVRSLRYARRAVDLFDSIPSEDAYYVLSKYDAYRRMAQVYIDMANRFSQQAYADSCYIYVQKVGNTLLAFGGYENHLQMRMTYAKYLSYMGKDKEALSVLQDCEQYFKHTSRTSLIAVFHEALSDAYEKVGDYKKSKEHYKMMYNFLEQSTNDSTLNIIANFKAEQFLKVQEAEKKQFESDRQRMRTIVISLICGLVLVSLLIFYIVRAFDVKHKANVLLSEKNALLNAQTVEIASQRDKIATQKDIITEQWREVESVNSKLISSIHYARRIQRAAVSSEADVKEIFPESFIFYCPRDIVSGDFYHAARYGRYSVMVVADCTGHGIPGAFLSMLGISALKEFLASEADAEMPGTVLDRMRVFIKSTLVGDRSSKRSVDDGMDITICCYDFQQMELRYALANQTVFILRGKEVIRLKGDSMPVGRYVREEDNFKTFSTTIQKGDMVYAFSDGIQDQLGGSVNRKFLLRNMISVFQDIADEPVEQQRVSLEQCLIDWRGDNPQVDDMTLVGIRV
ncbi:MAG: SpoIIE family protein phosphatase [Bacteroidales bacterium]|nr:SpoIIE family protein phosphatase [Bacteroidales bacterium]